MVKLLCKCIYYYIYFYNWNFIHSPTITRPDACVYVRVCTYTHTHFFLCVCMYIHTHSHFCVCVCVTLPDNINTSNRFWTYLPCESTCNLLKHICDIIENLMWFKYCKRIQTRHFMQKMMIQAKTILYKYTRRKTTNCMTIKTILKFCFFLLSLYKLTITFVCI